MKKTLFLFLLIAPALLGCRSSKEITAVPVKTVERVTERLVPVEVPADSAILTALFYCDSLNRVRLAEIDELKSRRVSTDLRFDSGKLNYMARAAPDTVYLPSKTVELSREIALPVEVSKTIYRQTKLQTFFYYIGILATVLAAAWLGLKLKSGSLLKIIFKLFKQ